jgi:hypothetical protein
MLFSLVFGNQCNLVFIAAYFMAIVSTAGMPDVRFTTLFPLSNLIREHRTLHDTT